MTGIVCTEWFNPNDCAGDGWFPPAVEAVIFSSNVSNEHSHRQHRQDILTK